MPRQPLPVGQHGNIRTRKLDTGNWRASTYVRGADGKRREVKREAPTKTGAQGSLQDALSAMPGVGSSGLTRESRLSDVAAAWLTRIDRRVEDDELAVNSARLYHLTWDNHVGPAVGALRVREATAGRIDDFLVALRRSAGAATAKAARAVLNGIMGHAVRAGATASNPVRDVSRISGGPTRPARALTAVERAAWLDALDEDYLAQRHDIPDLTAFLLGTGVRIGEALAVTTDEVSFADRTVRVNHKIIRVKGQGLVRVPTTKTPAGERTLKLMGSTVAMLEDRIRLYGEGPVFPSEAGTWRDPSNTNRYFREAYQRAARPNDDGTPNPLVGIRLTTHVFRKTVATVLDEAGLSARDAADQLGHSRVSMTQDSYFGRGVVTDRVVQALEQYERDHGGP